ncbi:MAG: hypothetical protein GC201_01655 [Alphaproteobacteria bacterium]|nr:hypothetical protein [Alphaproteobacteria bacterium]
MRLEEQAHPGSLLVQGYGDGGFRIGGARHEGSVLILPDGVHPWPVSSPDQITLEQLEPALGLDLAIDVLLVGCGPTMAPVSPDIARTLRDAHGIGIDCMDTGAACRTFNVLVLDGRQVGAALIAI